MQRYFAINEKLEISKDDKYHITKVMRMKKDDHIEIVWNKEVFLCNLDVVNSSEVVYSVCQKLSVNNEPEIYVTLAFSLVNETKTDFILQKGVELGISEFIPVSASRSKVKIDKKEDKKIQRWNKITKEAAEQSYRNIIPKVREIHTMKELINEEYDLKILCSTKENLKTIKNVLQNSTKCDKIIIVVGPEGGITCEEEKLLGENGFDLVTLGNTILRTETAPIFVMSAIRYELMR